MSSRTSQLGMKTVLIKSERSKMRFMDIIKSSKENLQSSKKSKEP